MTKEGNKEYEEIYGEVYEGKSKREYVIVYDTGRGQTGIKCLKCNWTSFNFQDIRDKYCGRCDVFHTK